ncbi:hypothetical protein BDB01DRAFT_791431 [Pilobolus umbonatus]|nr:hypothetical protein BDB01DRAFT_791431 [Pilobolus umbonatus]
MIIKTSAEWRPVMDYPIIGSSLMDIWSNRWHRVFRPIWVMLAYKPIYHFIQKWSQNSKTGKKFATLFASLGVFFISGLTHEYIVFCLAGWPIYQERYMGQQIMFFTTHGIFVIAEKIIGQSMRSVLPTHIRQSFLVKILLHLYVVTVVYYTFPYFLNGFAFWGMHRLENLFVFGTLFKRFLHNTPFLHPFCGSNV